MMNEGEERLASYCWKFLYLLQSSFLEKDQWALWAFLKPKKHLRLVAVVPDFKKTDWFKKTD